jgi:hypothetical protein
MIFLQFYVIVNVVRNVLLVPPPTNISKKQKDRNQAHDDENVDTKFMELPRDQALLAKNDFKSNLSQPLDIASRHHREELKLLLEECLKSDRLEVHVGTARLMEVEIGRCVWILRSASASGAVPVETGFSGIYATVSFSEDRSWFTMIECLRSVTNFSAFIANNQLYSSEKAISLEV